jgi:hypothetical protein
MKWTSKLPPPGDELRPCDDSLPPHGAEVRGRPTADLRPGCRPPAAKSSPRPPALSLSPRSEQNESRRGHVRQKRTHRENKAVGKNPEKENRIGKTNRRINQGRKKEHNYRPSPNTKSTEKNSIIAEMENNRLLNSKSVGSIYLTTECFPFWQQSNFPSNNLVAHVVVPPMVQT